MVSTDINNVHAGGADEVAAEATEAGRGDVANHEVLPQARSSALAAEGVATGTQFANLMAALMSDVIEGRISPVVSNAAVSAGRNLLKVVEMEYKYGGMTESPPTPARPTLQLTGK